jgi:hypothetical protein
LWNERYRRWNRQDDGDERDDGLHVFEELLVFRDDESMVMPMQLPYGYDLKIPSLLLLDARRLSVVELMQLFALRQKWREGSGSYLSVWYLRSLRTTDDR